jgi:hypothetical protein
LAVTAEKSALVLLHPATSSGRVCFNFSVPGDVVQVRGGPPLQLWQNGDWSIPWDAWLGGSALRPIVASAQTSRHEMTSRAATSCSPAMSRYRTGSERHTPDPDGKPLQTGVALNDLTVIDRRDRPTGPAWPKNVPAPFETRVGDESHARCDDHSYFTLEPTRRHSVSFHPPS